MVTILRLKSLVVNAQYISRQAGTGDTGECWALMEHLTFVFELKCAVRLLGHFAGLFARCIYVWERTLLLILLLCLLFTHRLCTHASASAERQICLVTCAVRILIFASDARSPAEPSTHHPN